MQYEAYRYAGEGCAGEIYPGNHIMDDGAVLASGTLTECREAIKARIGSYFLDPGCPWTPDEEEGAEAYSESEEDGCGGWIIRRA